MSAGNYLDGCSARRPLIHTEHDRVLLRAVQMEADDDLDHELGGGRRLERFDSLRVNPGLAPGPPYLY